MLLSELYVKKSNEFAETLGDDISVHSFRVITFIATVLQRHDFIISQYDEIGDTWRVELNLHDFAEVNNLKEATARNSLELAFSELKDRSDLFLHYDYNKGSKSSYVMVLTPDFAKKFSYLSGNYTSYNPIHTVCINDSLYALRFYEFLARWKNSKRPVAIATDKLKALVGMESLLDSKFHMNLKRILKVINQFTDLTATMEVAKSGRVLVGFRFKITIKPKDECYAYQYLDRVLTQGGFAFIPTDVLLGEKDSYRAQDKQKGRNLTAQAVESADYMPEQAMEQPIENPKKKKDNEPCNNMTTKTPCQTPCTTNTKETDVQDKTADNSVSTKGAEKADSAGRGEQLAQAYEQMRPCSLAKSVKIRYLQALGISVVQTCIAKANEYLDSQAQKGFALVNIAGVYNKALSENWAKLAENQAQKKSDHLAQVKAKEYAEHTKQLEQSRKEWEQSIAENQAQIAERERNKQALQNLEQELIEFYDGLNTKQQQSYIRRLFELMTADGAGFFVKRLKEHLQTNPHAFSQVFYASKAQEVMQEFKQTTTKVE